MSALFTFACPGCGHRFEVAAKPKQTEYCVLFDRKGTANRRTRRSCTFYRVANGACIIGMPPGGHCTDNGGGAP